MRTYQAKPRDITRKWYVLDAAEAPLGRLATIAASLLIGKGKPSFTKHIDTGDYVIITNAQNLVITGNKVQQKVYYNHSGYPGGLKAKTLGTKLSEDPTKIILQAVRGMLPVNKLRPARLDRLKIYSGTEHVHEAQQPEPFTIKSNVKGDK